MNVCAVIVTYGDRFHLLKQVIKACFREGVDKVIVIDNASAENSKKQLKELEKENKNKLKVIYLDENTGSAGGYKRGLEEAYKCSECEYILLLDDDNLIEENSLSILKELAKKNKTTDVFSLKRDINYINFIEQKGIDIILNECNYMGFNFLRFISRILYKKKGLYKKKSNKKIQINIAPYGGLFLNKEILKKTGFPNEKFFLYADDFEFTYRLSKHYNIYLLPFVKINDIDKSWNKEKMKNRNIYHPFICNGSDLKIYYLFKNSNYIEENVFKKNGFCFYFNKFTYLFLLTIIGILNFKFKRVSIIFKAILNKSI